MENLLANRYELKRFAEFAALFGCDPRLTPEQNRIDEFCFSFAGGIDSCRFVAGLEGGDGGRIAFFDIQIAQAEFFGRTGLRQRHFLSGLLSRTGFQAAVSAFHDAEGTAWRLSFAWQPDDLKTVIRRSFPAGYGIRFHQTQSQLMKALEPGKAGRSPTISELSEAFSRKEFLRDFVRNGHREFEKEYFHPNPSGQVNLPPYSAEEYSHYLTDYFRKLVEHFRNGYGRCEPDGSKTPEILNSMPYSMQESEPGDEIAAVDGAAVGCLYESLIQANSRKRSGTFYTPDEIVQYMCIETIADYLESRTGMPAEELRTFLGYGEWMGSGIFFEKCFELDRALAEVKLFDPAAGVGAFPIGMLNTIVKARLLIREFSDFRGAGSNEGQGCRNSLPDETAFLLKYHTVQNCIYAADRDKNAVSILRFRLWQALVAEAAVAKESDILSDYSGFRCNVICGDSLLGGINWTESDEHKEEVPFDIIIGNPPYISAVEGARNDRPMREAIRERYPLLKGAFDIYPAFLLNGMEKLRDGGAFCWIVPNKLMVSEYARSVLKYMKENGLKKVVSISDTGAFPRAGVYPVIISGVRRGAGNEAVGQESTEHLAEAKSFIADTLQELVSGRFRPSEDLGLKSYNTFADFEIGFSSGAAGFQAQRLANQLSGKAGTDRIPFVVSGSVDPFLLDFRNVRYMGKTYERAYMEFGGGITRKKWDFWCRDKIVIAGMTKGIEAVFHTGPLALGVGVYAVDRFGGFDPFFLLGLLNSSFMSWYVNRKFRERHLAGGYLAINKSTLEQLPLVCPDETLQSEIAEAARSIQLLELQHAENKKSIKRWMDRLNELVYLVYGLDSREIPVVEDFCSKNGL